MSTTSARVGDRAVADRSQIASPLLAILALGLIARLLFLGSDGFHNDVSAFEAWTLTLKDNPPWAFYAKSTFADYPPGYFVVLWLLGKFYALLPGSGADGAHGYALLKTLVKLPAIAMDLVDAGLVYAIARRYAARSVALLAAALLAFNPAAIYVSSYWGQVDSVSWGLVLAALWCVLRAGDDGGRKTVPRLVWAWLAFAFSLLIKPQAATIGLLFLAYPLATTDAAVRARRLVGTAAGVLAALVLAYGIGALFGAGANPLHVFGWLLGRYAFGSGVYQYNTVNAFNLWAIASPFWQLDSQSLRLFGFALAPLSLAGIVLVVAATGLVVVGYLQRRDDRALLEGAMIVALIFFALATRMHERYVYGAFLLAMPLIAFGRVGLWSALLLSLTTYLNLAYSFAYQSVMEAHTAGVDATNLWPAISHPASLANLLLLGVLTWRYLGTQRAAAHGATALGDLTIAIPEAAGGRSIAAFVASVRAKLRGWFDPREGIARLTRTDWLFMGGFVVVAFAIAIVNLAWPNEKIFDEVYFARAGEEYLKGVPQFEWTHPPFTKLVIALSIALLGDNSLGWRFLNVVIGSLQIAVLYAFAKRLTSSTLFAALAALLLTFDGFHFVEQRISTGEITISTLILIVLYSFYRYWLTAQVRLERLVAGRFGRRFVITLLCGLPVAVAFAWLVNRAPANHTTPIANGIWPSAPGSSDMAAFAGAAYEVSFLYVMVGFYLLARLLGSRGPATGRRVSYADGTTVQIVPPAKPAVAPPPGPAKSAELKIDYGRDGSMRYTTPVASAEFDPDGTLRVDGEPVSTARSARLWLAVLAVSLGLLLSSKWNGFFDLGVVFAVSGLVWAQRFLKGRALYGNPYGFPLDVVAALLLFVPATIYGLSYIPTYVLGGGHNLTDLMALQWQMYNYHSHVGGTHPYMSVWWQWPIMQIPISYYYHDFRLGAAINQAGACCVAEILALPNPLVFLLGLASVPYVGWLAWRERNKGYALVVLAYFLQWLPWFHSPRMLFEYHFFPNLALIVLCDVILLQRLARRAAPDRARWYLAAYAVAVIASFAYFYPVLAGTQVSYQAWYARMWPDRMGIPGTSWIIPHRN